MLRVPAGNDSVLLRQNVATLVAVALLIILIIIAATIRDKLISLIKEIRDELEKRKERARKEKKEG